MADEDVSMVTFQFVKEVINGLLYGLPDGHVLDLRVRVPGECLVSDQLEKQRQAAVRELLQQVVLLLPGDTPVALTTQQIDDLFGVRLGELPHLHVPVRERELGSCVAQTVVGVGHRGYHHGDIRRQLLGDPGERVGVVGGVELIHRVEDDHQRVAIRVDPPQQRAEVRDQELEVGREVEVLGRGGHPVERGDVEAEPGEHVADVAAVRGTFRRTGSRSTIRGSTPQIASRAEPSGRSFRFPTTRGR